MTERFAETLRRLKEGESFRFTVDGFGVHGRFGQRLEPPQVSSERVTLKVVYPKKRGVPSKFAFDIGDAERDQGLQVVTFPSTWTLEETLDVLNRVENREQQR